MGQEPGLPSVQGQETLLRTDGPFLASPILTVDQEVMFTQSALGQRIIAQLERDRVALAAENRRIEAELSEEEQTLTRQRPTLQPHEFSDLADAFNEKVQTIRETQDGKARALQQRLDQDRQSFVELAAPILTSIAQTRGAVMVLDATVVLISADTIDITAEVIEQLNTAIGDGISDFAAPPSTVPTPTPRVGAP